MGDQDQHIHLKEIYVDFIERRPTYVLELIFKDHAGVNHKSNKFRQGDIVHWNIDTYVMTHTSGTLSIWQALFEISVAEISVNFERNEFGENGVVRLQDRNHRVSVLFVCGASNSLENDTRAAGGSQARTSLTSKLSKALKLPQLAAPAPPPPHATFHQLNDDILLDIFNCYRLDEKKGWNHRLGWRKLSHVCRRWRHLIYQSPFHLDVQIQCANGTPMLDTLDHLRSLPLHIDYRHPRTEQNMLGLYPALRLYDRVRRIDLRLSPSILRKCLVIMGAHFPILENLSLKFENGSHRLELPQAFLAPNIRSLALFDIPLPNKLQFLTGLLTSTVSLVTLKLRIIQTSSSCFVCPTILVESLESLPQLQHLAVITKLVLQYPRTERELLSGHAVTLPNLKSLEFRGVDSYLESFLAQMKAPLLEELDVTLYDSDRIPFTLPHLSHLINITERLKLPTAKVSFGRDKVVIVMPNRRSPEPFRLRVSCTLSKHLKWQIEYATQICSALIPALSDVDQLVLDSSEEVQHTKWMYGTTVDSSKWHELLKLFIGVKMLYIENTLLRELSRVLQDGRARSTPGFLPNLQYIFAASDLFAPFICDRQNMGRPVQFVGPTAPASS